MQNIGHKQSYRQKDECLTGLAEWRMGIIAKWPEVLFGGCEIQEI